MTQLTNITLDEIIYRGQIGELSPLSQEDWVYLEKVDNVVYIDRD